MHASPSTVSKLHEIEASAQTAVIIAKKAGELNDRSWLAIILSFGLCTLCVILYWHREDQKAMSDLFANTIKQNTEALARVSSALDRLDRRAL